MRRQTPGKLRVFGTYFCASGGQPLPGSLRGHLCPRVEAELVSDLLKMCFGRTFGYEQPRRDLSVGQTFLDDLRKLSLSPRKKDGRVTGQWAQPDLWGIYRQLTAPRS
jgi:hypothetical protein